MGEESCTAVCSVLPSCFFYNRSCSFPCCRLPWHLRLLDWGIIIVHSNYVSVVIFGFMHQGASTGATPSIQPGPGSVTRRVRPFLHLGWPLVATLRGQGGFRPRQFLLYVLASCTCRWKTRTFLPSRQKQKHQELAVALEIKNRIFAVVRQSHAVLGAHRP